MLFYIINENSYFVNRTTTNFYFDTDSDHANKEPSECPLAAIPGFDFVRRVILDEMHLKYLGKLIQFSVPETLVIHF